MKKNHNMHKNYYEYRALYTLQKLYPSEYGNFIHGDKPDLFDPNTSVGVEVVRAVDPKSEENMAYFNRYLNKRPLCEIPDKQLLNFEESDNHIITMGDLSLEPFDMVIGYTPPAIWFNLNSLKNAINKKTDYLDRTTWKTETLELYLFTDSFKEYELQDVFEIVRYTQVMQTGKKRQYRSLFVDDCGWFYRCDLQNSRIIYHNTEEILHEICVRSKETADRSDI